MIPSTSLQAAALSALLLGAGASPIISPIKRQTIEPAIAKDFPDPSVMQAADGRYYAYATAGNGVQCQVAVSDNGVDWTLQEGHDGIAGIPWSPENPQVWAPDVTPGSNGVYNMMFSAIASSTGDAAKHCVGFATSTDPLGPFQPQDDPWVCDEDTGDIDPDQFLDEDGSRWVLWKVDGNSAGHDSTPIMIQQVEDDGYSKIGTPTKILDRDEADGPLVEAPSLVKVDGTYYLTFSSNMYDSQYYDTSYATSDCVACSYTKAQAPDAPLIVTNDNYYGPGGADMLVVANNQLILWHGWDSEEKNARYLFASSMNVGDGKIQIYYG
ncbi:uncharacterized protein LTR77_008068 [Saxophila tyrrhenica]|uniref:Glycoside hydrolase family 43 protein n=1 Tax=Saxophila tyrrhenica TaxID=1690608 RepID=A0AAV9P3P5_9PEZI|nr:hypothetical protein LTR77_008068 [Saxophila tyrrhenica]